LANRETYSLRGDLVAARQYINGAYNKDRGRHFTRARSDRTRGNCFKLKEAKFSLHKRKRFFYSEGGETLEQVAQRSCRCPIVGSVQGQAGQVFEEPALVERCHSPL